MRPTIWGTLVCTSRACTTVDFWQIVFALNTLYNHTTQPHEIKDQVIDEICRVDAGNMENVIKYNGHFFTAIFFYHFASGITVNSTFDEIMTAFGNVFQNRKPIP